MAVLKRFMSCLRWMGWRGSPRSAPRGEWAPWSGPATTVSTRPGDRFRTTERKRAFRAWTREVTEEIRRAGRAPCTRRIAAASAIRHPPMPFQSTEPTPRPVATPIRPVERGFAVLEAFVDGVGWLANQDISARTGLPRATVSRLTRTLTALGYLRHCGRRRQYRLAVAVLTLGYAASLDSATFRQARPSMQKLADDARVVVSIAGRDGLDMVLLESCHATGDAAAAGVASPLGRHLPMATTPAGWALLAGLPPPERHYLLDRLRPRHGRDEWPAIHQKITRAASQIAARAWCVSATAAGDGITTLAMPLLLREASPLVLVAAGPGRLLSNAVIALELGPRMLALRQSLQEAQKDGGQD
ncbi:helix-turn-helix domain-containing protein [Xylophilus sp. Kf1]|nr:helix-turn-helix domain-containing protein [Xylophilus sp. Kf1]